MIRIRAIFSLVLMIIIDLSVDLKNYSHLDADTVSSFLLLCIFIALLVLLAVLLESSNGNSP